MKNLKVIKKKVNGRNHAGQVVMRHRGGAHKRFLRIIDFKRSKRGMDGIVMSIEYDPNRTCDIALINYPDGDKRYILAPHKLSVNDTIRAGETVLIRPGNATMLKNIPVGTFVHNVELTPGKGGQLARGAGTAAVVSALEGNYAHLKLPSGELRKVFAAGYATIGQVGNIDKKNEEIGSAGRARHMGIRPGVRGVAMNPRSHPHGGGEGRSGIGMPGPKNYSGRSAVGKRRSPKKYSNKYILERRKQGPHN